jgi:hypothetical protein
MIPAPYVANPLADAIIHIEAGAAEHIDAAGYSRVRGFVHGRLTRDETPGFDAALRLLAGAETGERPLSSTETITLWQVGLIILPQERAEPFAALDTPFARDNYVRHGFEVVPRMVTPEAARILVEHYRPLAAAGKLALGDRQANRYRAHNDPAGRVALSALRATVERIVGSPLKGSYSYASLYRGGTDLPRHLDRPQCRYTVSLQLDHRPSPPDGRSPWPIQLYLDPDAPPLDCLQTIGGGILFRGCDIPHGRPPLPPDQESWLLLLHYVDVEFEGSLN